MTGVRFPIGFKFGILEVIDVLGKGMRELRCTCGAEFQRTAIDVQRNVKRLESEPQTVMGCRQCCLRERRKRVKSEERKPRSIHHVVGHTLPGEAKRKARPIKCTQCFDDPHIVRHWYRCPGCGLLAVDDTKQRAVSTISSPAGSCLGAAC